MKRYRVTFRSTPGLGLHLRSTNVPAGGVADAVMRAARILTAYPAHRIAAVADRTEVRGVVTRETGSVHLFANQSGFWTNDPAETWRYEVLLDEPSGFDLDALVEMGRRAGPIPPRA